VGAAVIKNLTLSLDYLGEHVLSASRLATVTTLGVANTPASSGSYETVGGAVGFKWKPVNELLVSGNLLGKFDHNELHHTAVPLMGISYTF
jgi:hypothetical protein